jgi:ferrous iron transport protein B
LQALTMIGLYLLGAVTALASAALLRSTLLRGNPTTFYMELPPYRLPTARLLATQIWRSARAFLRRAGTLILALSILLWALLSFPRLPESPETTPEAHAQAQLEASYGAALGHALEPAIAPLGWDWRIGVGLVASLAAREVLVATLAQIYAVGSADSFDGLRDALARDIDPQTGRRALDLPAALALLVFFVFALQCTSTIVVMARETGSFRWPALAFAYMLGLAYGASFVTYRIASAMLA